MSTHIRRSEQRTALKEQPRGKFWLMLDDECADVISVRDISPKGISLQVDRFIDKVSGVRVKYQNDMVDMMINGVVVWNTPAEITPNRHESGKSYMVGINLLSPNLLYSFI